MKPFNIALVVVSQLLYHARSEAAAIAYLFALEEDNYSFIDAGAMVVRTEAVGDRTVRTYRLGEHTVVGALLSSGQTESAVSTEMILARRRVDAVITTGVVGAIDESVKVGDKVLINRILGWQVGSYTASGWGETTRARPKVTPWTLGGLSWVTVGVASGDVFVASESERGRIAAQSGMQVIDMNLLGIQSAINAHHLPALHLRVVSDRADANASEEFRKFVATYDGELGRAVALLIKSLPMDRESPEAYPAIRALEPKP